MSHDELPILPRSLTDQSAIIAFRASLSEADRCILDDLFAQAARHNLSINAAGHPYPMHVYLLTLLLEKHNDNRRLRHEIELLLAQRGLTPPGDV